MEKSLLDQDRASEQIHCENNRLKEEMEKLNKKIASYEPMQEELKKLVCGMHDKLCICSSVSLLDPKNSI